LLFSFPFHEVKNYIWGGGSRMSLIEAQRQNKPIHVDQTSGRQVGFVSFGGPPHAFICKGYKFGGGSREA